MTTYAWPGFDVVTFHMEVQPNVRTFKGPYSPTEQVVDLQGERWVGQLALAPATDVVQGAQIEAFLNRLHGVTHTFTLHHLRREAPNGTLRDGAAVTVRNGLGATVSVRNGLGATVQCRRGQPALLYAVAQGGYQATVVCLPGATLVAGDMLGVAGQLVQVTEGGTANASGYLPIEFTPRARSAWAVGAPVQWDAPTFTAALSADAGPVTWARAVADGPAIDFAERL